MTTIRNTKLFNALLAGCSISAAVLVIGATGAQARDRHHTSNPNGNHNRPHCFQPSHHNSGYIWVCDHWVRVGTHSPPRRDCRHLVGTPTPGYVWVCDHWERAKAPASPPVVNRPLPTRPPIVGRPFPTGPINTRPPVVIRPPVIPLGPFGSVPFPIGNPNFPVGPFGVQVRPPIGIPTLPPGPFGLPLPLPNVGGAVSGLAGAIFGNQERPTVANPAGSTTRDHRLPTPPVVNRPPRRS